MVVDTKRQDNQAHDNGYDNDSDTKSRPLSVAEVLDSFSIGAPRNPKRDNWLTWRFIDLNAAARLLA